MTTLPGAIPEIPVSDIETAATYYVGAFGFVRDWTDSASGIAGLSHGDCRIFLADTGFRSLQGNTAPVVLWLNLDGRQAVDELYERWRSAGATILSAPEDKPWNLHEFTAADREGNRLRVFYDFTWEQRPVTRS